MVQIKGKNVYVLHSGARCKLLQRHGEIVLLALLGTQNNRPISYMVCSYPSINGYALDYRACVYYNNYNTAYYATHKAIKSGLGALLV